MYQSPIAVFMDEIQTQIRKDADKQIYHAVVNVGVSVDKEELIRALQYDRDQYQKGYADGERDAVKHGRWEVIDVTDELHKCSVCGEWQYIPEENFAYCPYCGAKMDGNEEEV